MMSLAGTITSAPTCGLTVRPDFEIAVILPRVGVLELRRITWSMACTDSVVTRQTNKARPIEAAREI